jgi:hypothetical protein
MVTLKRLRNFTPLILSLLLGIILFFLVKDFIQTVIIGPLLYVVWFTTLIAESIPQGVIWAIFILIMTYIAISSLQKKKTEKSIYSQLPAHNSGQVEKWSRLLETAQKDRFTRWRLANELKRLSRRLLTPPDQDVRNHNLDQFDLPPEILAYFESQQPTKIPFWDWLNQVTIEDNETALDIDPEVVIGYLEERLGL